MAVGQEKEILFPTVGIARHGGVLHDFVEQGDHEFRGTERAARVSGVYRSDHAQNVSAGLRAEVFEGIFG